MLAFVPPQVPTASPDPPDGDGWIHEIKHDGFRTMIAIENGQGRAFSRSGYDWTARYGPTVNACRKLACQSALIDGEIVVEDENGVSDFDALQPAIRYEPHRLVFFAFDLVHLDGVDLRRRPLLERREKLASLIGPGCFAVRYSEHFEGDAKAFFAGAVKHGLESIVSKRAMSPYRSGRQRLGSRQRT
jgi:bifunctional non-homologous end joining protein LigD